MPERDRLASSLFIVTQSVRLIKSTHHRRGRLVFGRGEPTINSTNHVKSGTGRASVPVAVNLLELLESQPADMLSHL